MDPQLVEGTSGGTGGPSGGGADYLLTLDGHPGGTVYFSDRLERICGESPTQAFLDGLGFPPAIRPTPRWLPRPRTARKT